MTNYIKMTEPEDPSNGPVMTVEEAKEQLDGMVRVWDDHGLEEEGISYTFSVVEMTHEEFENLPDFKGF